MALNYIWGQQIESNVTADNNGDSIDLVGYSKLAVHVVWGTTAGTSNTAVFKVETSNDGQNWATYVTLFSQADLVTWSGTNTFAHLPDNATANEFGFGRYIRFVLAASSWTTSSANYTVKWLAKE